jgi:hypothetical protein
MQSATGELGLVASEQLKAVLQFKHDETNKGSGVADSHSTPEQTRNSHMAMQAKSQPGPTACLQ